MKFSRLRDLEHGLIRGNFVDGDLEQWKALREEARLALSQLAAARQELDEKNEELRELCAGEVSAAEWCCSEIKRVIKSENDSLRQQLAASRERERTATDLLNQIACRCTSELQDRSGHHVARVPGSRQWRDALYSIRLQIESMLSPSQTSAEGKE